MTEDETKQLAVFHAIESMASMYQSLAVVGALVEKGLIDPMRVAHWAAFFATQSPNDLPEVKAAIADRLKQFAELIEAMAKKPAGAGRA